LHRSDAENRRIVFEDIESADPSELLNLWIGFYLNFEYFAVKVIVFLFRWRYLVG